MSVDWVLDLVRRLSEHLVEQLQYVIVMVVYSVARATAVTVQSGYHGVLFSFGRARHVVGPGLHWLLPFLQVVRVLPTRTRTIDLPGQRVTTRDGLVVDVDAVLAYRVADVARALVEIDRLEKGMTQLLGLAVQDVLRGLGRDELRGSADRDLALAAAMQASLEPWGIAVERAGFRRIAPTRATLALLQLGMRGAARRAWLDRLVVPAGGLDRALALLGGAPRIVRRAARARDAEARAAEGRVAVRVADRLFRAIGGGVGRRAFRDAARAFVAGGAPSVPDASARWVHRHQDPDRAEEARARPGADAASGPERDARVLRRASELARRPERLREVVGPPSDRRTAPGAKGAPSRDPKGWPRDPKGGARDRTSGSRDGPRAVAPARHVASPGVAGPPRGKRPSTRAEGGVPRGAGAARAGRGGAAAASKHEHRGHDRGLGSVTRSSSSGRSGRPIVR